MSDVTYRQAEPGDRRELRELFLRVKPVIARTSSRITHRAIIADALAARNVMIHVAVQDGRLAGFVIAAWNWARFKREFPLRHPLAAFAMVCARLRQRFARKPNSESAVSASTDGPVTEGPHPWNDSAGSIAKVVFIGVDSPAQGRGVGRGLYADLIRYLATKRFTRIDACIDLDNIASLKMHERAGWTVSEYEGGYYAFMDINSEDHGSQRQ